MNQVRAQIVADHSYNDAFQGSLPPLPDSTSTAIVFVRYSRAHNDGLSLVRNVTDLDYEPIWVAYDRGAENVKLMSIAPQRTPYLFDEAAWKMRPLDRNGAVIKESPGLRD